MVDTLTPERRSWVMSRIKGKDTKPELLLRSLLHKRGFRFRIHDKRLPGKPDIVLPRYRTVILVHGCFWHHHEGCKRATTPKTRAAYWKKKFEANRKRDAASVSALEEMGWKVLVVWECEVSTEGSHGLFERLESFLDDM